MSESVIKIPLLAYQRNVALEEGSILLFPIESKIFLMLPIFTTFLRNQSPGDGNFTRRED